MQLAEDIREVIEEDMGMNLLIHSDVSFTKGENKEVLLYLMSHSQCLSLKIDLSFAKFASVIAINIFPLPNLVLLLDGPFVSDCIIL